MESIEELRKEIKERESILLKINTKKRKLETEINHHKKGKTKRFILFLISLIPLIQGVRTYEVGKSLPIILLVIGLFIGGYFFIVLMRDLVNIPSLQRSLSKLQKESNKLNEEVSKRKNTLSSIVDSKKNKLNELIKRFVSEIDKDGDNTIDVIHHDDEFMKILKSNQKVILEMEKSENRDYTKQFVKLSNFLVDKEKNLQSVFQRMSSIDKLEQFGSFRSNLIQQIQFYNVLRLNSLQMISSFVDNDRITFYIIYEKFDKLGVWNTNFENQFLFKMDLLNSNIDRLLSEINNMSDSINQSINELISITEENTSSLSEKLSNIGSKLDMSNMLNTINTYQNYKTNKRLR